MTKWDVHMKLINAIFFTDDDVIQKDTDDYKDFLNFLDKYERFNSRKIGNPSKLHGENKFEFPEKFSRRYKVNFAISSNKLKERYKEVWRSLPRHYDSGLKFDDVLEFKQILIFYFDFLQKQKMAKVVKIKREQNNLPIKQYEEQIVTAIQNHQKVIVAGDTGCGKSTQVPQYLLSAGFSKIACTQPRRIACISLAKRVAYETFSGFMTDIAYQVRFETNKNKSTRVLFLTEGLLLRQFQSDPTLSQYNVIVVDEIHERHVNGDFLLGVLKCLLEQRNDLKIILMSATINIDLFSSYFKDAPVIQVPGRLYSIELQYLPHFLQRSSSSESREKEQFDPSPYLKVMQLIDKKYSSSERGDLLIFLSGMTEISTLVEAARHYASKTKSWIVLPLHSSLSVEDQEKIFDISPEGVRKCVVSTNIAETSITIDGVRFIADSGKAKEMIYDPQCKMKRLQEFWISQASAQQRKGRAGRTGPGICYRLYSEEDYYSFVEYSTPEIHRLPLESLVLQMANLGLYDATKFPFIEPPEKSNISNATSLLKDLNALTSDGQPTPLGNMLSQLPVDIAIGKMLIMASLFDIVDPILVIAAALSVQSPLTRRLCGENDYDVEQRRKEFYSRDGDPFFLLRAYDEWILVKADRSLSSRKWCKRRGFEEQRFYEMTKLKRQFEEILRDHKLLRLSEHHKTQSERREDAKLRRLKRENEKTGSRRRKLLKLDESTEEQPDNDTVENNEMIDLHDINFKLSHNLMQLEKSSKRNRRFTYRDLYLMKLILTSGLFPQFVVPDETNIHRKPSEHVFHTKDKQYLNLHPLSVYALCPDFLEDLYLRKNSEKALQLPSKNILVYVSLLETNKPYVVNVMSVPALQSLFLLSACIDTNLNCTRFVFNEWIELAFTEGEQTGKDILSVTVQLRNAWDKLLQEKLNRKFTDDKDVTDANKKVEGLEKVISLKLAEFIDTSIDHTLRRISSAEIKHFYVGNENITHVSNDLKFKQTTDFAPKTDSLKGGVSLTPYITYGCLKDENSVAIAMGKANYLQEHYDCSKCGIHFVFTVLERIKHDEICSLQKTEENIEKASHENESTEAVTSSVDEKLLEDYFCKECDKIIRLTKIEILKHRNNHRKEYSTNLDA